MGKNDRFDRIYSQGTMNVTEIWVYREIGVNYVFHAAANAGGMTPLLDREGKLVFSPIKKCLSPAKTSNFSPGCCRICSVIEQADLPNTSEKTSSSLRLDKEKYKAKELARQIDSGYYERLLLSNGKAPSAIEGGLHPRCHFEDITRADYYGFVVPFATELMKLSKDSGAPIKIRACDTMGYGISYPGVSLPRSVLGIIYGLKHFAGVPSEMLEWHGHNDFYKGVVNASTAWLYGAGAVNCSLLGIGERTGNVPFEAMVFEYASLRGDFDGMNPTVVTEIAEYLEKETGYETPPMTPFVGRNFNLTRAGIHADGIMKDPEIYNIFDTELILNRPPIVAISNTSGLAGIAVWINQYYGLKGAEAIDKKMC